MRKALLAVEALPLTANTPISIPGYGTGEVMYHVGLLYDHGFVKGLKIPLRGHTVYHPDGLTASGHECLDSIRDEGVWEKAKAISLQRTGSVTFESIRLALADLWLSLGEEKVLSTAASSANLDNRPFTTPEQMLIATKLDEIKKALLEGQQFAAEQADIVDREFAYLKESSRRLGRKDWLNVLYGGLITVIVGVATFCRERFPPMMISGSKKNSSAAMTCAPKRCCSRGPPGCASANVSISRWIACAR
jgi:hypothetical protein